MNIELFVKPEGKLNFSGLFWRKDFYKIDVTKCFELSHGVSHEGLFYEF
jgi:hypothetical protein